jgi:Zn-dependent peptidase ImmA (M78 family)/DNA-binding XRE family transcriptional regulator
MARKSLKVNVNPAVMKWARESAGLDTDTVKKRLNVSTGTIQEWEQGTKKPTLTTLETLASYYKRPLAAFFLPEPPPEPSMPTDFRVLPREKRHPLSKKTRLAIRRATRVQSLATELEQTKGDIGETIANIASASLSDDPEITAESARSSIAITVEDQYSFKSLYEAFDKWRGALESLNIVVYQTPFPLEEARGFSLLDHKLPIIVINISDAIAARIFTLFHEYAHLLLGASGICIPNETYHDDADAQEVERFCDHFAGSFLVPKHALQKDKYARIISHQSSIDDDCLSDIAQRFKVSKQVILRRLLFCGLISRDQYMNKLEELLSQLRQILSAKRSNKQGFGLRPSKRCVLENGRLFSSLVMEAKEREYITYSDLADYLSINLKHLGEVQALLQK